MKHFTRVSEVLQLGMLINIANHYRLNKINYISILLKANEAYETEYDKPEYMKSYQDTKNIIF